MEDRIASLFMNPSFFWGSLFLLVAVIETFTGTAITRGQGLVYRVKEPKTFWCLVVISYIVAILFYAQFFYNVPN